ncbi:MAG: stage V sporulation protein AB [Lachnospiraceae bacterium]|nr:stage V sporulation protein AB [Lachnospiraceae bacterium]
MFKLLGLGFGGLCFGLLSAAGVFTILTAVGLIPRFVGKTHSAKEIFLYENLIILGTITGGVFSLFGDQLKLGAWLQNILAPDIATWLSRGILMMAGLFAGMFIGCLALAIAEMLDSIPIFTRRIAFRHGLGFMILSIAMGKLFGTLYFFIKNIVTD